VIFRCSGAGMPSTVSGYPRVGGIAAGAAVRVRRMHPSLKIHHTAVLLCEKSSGVFAFRHLAHGAECDAGAQREYRWIHALTLAANFLTAYLAGTTLRCNELAI
jgi:hypothetical protein